MGGHSLKCQELSQAPDSYGVAEGEGEGTRRGEEMGAAGRGRRLQRVALRGPLPPHLIWPPDSCQNQSQSRKWKDSGYYTEKR